MKSGYAFLIALTVAGIALWLFGHVLNQYGMAIVFTLGAMISYFGWIIWSERIRKDYEQYADSVYYLGFMLTLISLLVALWGVEKDGADFTGLVQKFGLGLSATLLGLAGRIWMLEFGKDPEEIQEEVATMLRESAQDLALQLHQGRGVLKNAYNELSQQVLEQQGVLANSVLEAAGTFSRALGAVTLNILKSAEETSRELESVTGNAAKVIAEASNSMMLAMKTSADSFHDVLGGRAKSINTSLTNLESSINNIHIPSDVFEKELSHALAGARKSFEQLGNVVETGNLAALEMVKSLNIAKGSASSLASYFAEVNKTAAALSSSKDQITSLTETILNFDKELQLLEGRFKNYTDNQILSASQLHDIFVEQSSAIGELRAKLEEDVKASTLATRQVHEELARNARFIIEKLGV